MRTTFPPSNASMKRINLIALGVFVLLVVAVFFFDTKTTRAIQSTVLSIFGVAHKAADAVSGDGFTVDGEDYTPDGLMKRFTHEELAEEHSKLVRESNELRFTPDDVRLAEVGWNRQDLTQVTLQLGQGVWLGEYFTGRERVDIYLKTQRFETPEEMAAMPVSTPSSIMQRFQPIK